MAKIFAVDDEEHILTLYAEELKESGHEVVTATSGHKLLERVHQEQPDLVIIDIRLGDEDGLTLLEALRNSFYDLPVILATAYDTFKEDRRSLSADGYFVKSFSLDDLKRQISMALEAHQSFQFPENINN